MSWPVFLNSLETVIDVDYVLKHQGWLSLGLRITLANFIMINPQGSKDENNTHAKPTRSQRIF